MANQFMRADEVAKELGISRSYAYKLIWLLNQELKERGFLTIAGRINRDLITEAINFFCARRLALENDPYLETRQKEDRFLQQMEERIEQAIRQAEARGFANAMQMMQAGMTLPSPAASMAAQNSPVPQPDSAEDRTLDEESLNMAMDFIDSL